MSSPTDVCPEVRASLLKKGADPNIEGRRGYTPLSISPLRGDAAIRAQQLTKGIYPNFKRNCGQGEKTDSVASQKGHFEICDLLGKSVFFTNRLSQPLVAPTRAPSYLRNCCSPRNPPLRLAFVPKMSFPPLVRPFFPPLIPPKPFAEILKK